MLSVAKIIMANLVATNGIEINQIEKQITGIDRENKSLNEEITKLSSIKRISEEAVRLGFASSSTVASLSQQTPLALR